MVGIEFLRERRRGKTILSQYLNQDEQLQKLHDEFIENTISNFYIPYAIAPNFVINGRPYALPMAIEESSVVAAASLSAKFWSERGGFKARGDFNDESRTGPFYVSRRERGA